MDATEAAVHFAQALMGPRLDRAAVREALVEVVGADDYRTRKWDEFVAQLP